jgi:hypothetical protein
MNERIATLENDNRELRTQLHEAQRGPSVMADDDQHDGGMSQSVATLYRALFEELKFAKQQQWTTTNYLLLVLAAIFGIGKVIDPLTDCEKIIATLLLLTAVGFSYYVLIDLQLYIAGLRLGMRAPPLDEKRGNHRKQVASIGIDRHDRGQKQVVALVGAATGPVPFHAVADAEINEIELGVV